MITTITTTTTSVATAAIDTLSMIVVLALIAFVIQREVIRAINTAVAARIARGLTIAIVPLWLVFIVVLLLKVRSVIN